MNYIDITKIDLFPVVQNYPPVRFSLHARLQASLRSTCTKKSRIPTECSRYHCGEGGDDKTSCNELVSRKLQLNLIK